MKILFFFLLIFLATGSYSQNIFFRNESGLGLTLVKGDMSSTGLSAFTEPKVFFGSRLGFGLRLEGTALFGGMVETDKGEVSLGLTARSAFLGKAEYYFAKGLIRPFVALSAGKYRMADKTLKINGAASLSGDSEYGLAPEFGLVLGGIKISGMYHLVFGNGYLELENGESMALSRNYFVIQLGIKTLGFGDRK